MKPQERPHGLYVLTFLIELLITAGARALVYGILFYVPLMLAAGIMILFDENALLQLCGGLLSFLLSVLGLAVVFGPLIMSVLAYVGSGAGHTMTRFALGAREMSRREADMVNEALQAIVEAAGSTPVTGFADKLVIDSPLEYMYLIGTTLYVSSASVRSRHLRALLAHEVGHSQNGDGATVLALRRFVFPLFYVFIANVRDFSTSRPTGASADKSQRPKPADIFYSMVNTVIFLVFSWFGGGVGVWLLSWPWASYFRERDYLADQFVAACGMTDELVAFLEENRFYDTSVPYMLGWQPANELRIDRLMG